MRGVFFGLGLQYDDGDGPTVAINSQGRVVDVHKNEAGVTLYYRAGTVDQMTVKWAADAHDYTNGVDPSVALNGGNRVVEVHKSEAFSELYSSIGTLGGDLIQWAADPDNYTSGLTPSVALNDAGKVVEVHRSEKTTRLYYRFGKLGSTNVDWKFDDDYDTGETPKVAINNGDWVVEVHKSELLGTDLWYHVGKINEAEKKIDFGDSIPFATGSSPTVALTDAGDVIVSWIEGINLQQKFGQLVTSNKTINWIGNAAYYDDGVKPSVAAAGRMAITAHEGEALKTLWFSTSLITDRAIWMTEHRAALGPRNLSQLALPASHDSGMYEYGIDILGKTQDLSIFQQLEYGIRYFDLRPKWLGNKFIIHHGPIPGPDLIDVWGQIADYCRFGHKELIVIDWSHFEDFDAFAYDLFTEQTDALIGQWQFKGPLQPGQRLADIPLSQFTANGPCIISAVAENWAIDQPKPGFWVFRDWDASDSDRGQLVVFDKYSNTTNYDEMRDDQLAKFASYTGKQQNFPSLPATCSCCRGRSRRSPACGSSRRRRTGTSAM